jgi:hypothetical protein
LTVVVEGIIDSVEGWSDRGQVATVVSDGGTYTVGFAGKLRVPRRGFRVRIQAVQGSKWLFAKSWEYLASPRGRTRAGFVPVSEDPELERAVLGIIHGLNEFTVDDLHVLEDMIVEKGRDLRILGSILRKLKQRGLIKEIRMVHSSRDTCHRRPVVLWTRVVPLDAYSTMRKGSEEVKCQI